MDSTQKRYALTRIKEVTEAHLKRLRVKYTKPGKEITNEAKMKLIRNRRVQLLPDIEPYESLMEAFDFSKVERPEEFNQDGYAAEANAFLIRANAVKDAVMLGSQEQATEETSKFLDTFDK